uniref:Uncharacterized protein n=1 Tax=Anopheles dirus TaxID=7168 RepID=A0A182MZ58_9DIPT
MIGGRAGHVKTIFEKIKSGYPHLLDHLRTMNAPRECAKAFQQFLLCYQVLVLPQRCIDIVLGNVVGVPRRLIALDVLNLLLEEYEDTRLHFAKRYLQMMRCYTLYGYLRPTEMQTVLTPYLALSNIFPGPNERRGILLKSMTLLEMFLLAQLLDDPIALSAELQRACTSYRATKEGTKANTKR